MKIRNYFNSSKIQDIAGAITIIIAIPTFIIWFVSLFNVTSSLILSKIAAYREALFNFTIIFSLLFLGTVTWRLSRRFTISFVDNFRHGLNEKWDYEGDWKIVENETLCVRNSGIGGITKNGSHWENYDFEFETKIINECSSWIIRAQDFNNYFMFQCRKDVLRPHQRVTFPKIKQEPNNPSDTIAAENLIVSLEGAWKIWDGRPHNSNLDDWTKVKIRVRGSEVIIWIADKIVFHESNLIPYATGKVGFRNHGNEEAHFRKVRVRPLY